MREPQRIAAEVEPRPRLEPLPVAGLEVVGECADLESARLDSSELHVALRRAAEDERPVAGKLVPRHRRQRTGVRIAERRQRLLAILQQPLHVQPSHGEAEGDPVASGRLRG